MHSDKIVFGCSEKWKFIAAKRPPVRGAKKPRPVIPAKLTPARPKSEVAGYVISDMGDHAEVLLRLL